MKSSQPAPPSKPNSAPADLHPKGFILLSLKQQVDFFPLFFLRESLAVVLLDC